MNKEDPDEEVGDHAKDVDENANVDEAIHLVGNDESSTDDNFDIVGQGFNKTIKRRLDGIGKLLSSLSLKPNIILDFFISKGQGFN